MIFSARAALTPLTSEIPSAPASSREAKEVNPASCSFVTVAGPTPGMVERSSDDVSADSSATSSTTSSSTDSSVDSAGASATSTLDSSSPSDSSSSSESELEYASSAAASARSARFLCFHLGLKSCFFCGFRLVLVHHRFQHLLEVAGIFDYTCLGWVDNFHYLCD